MPRNKHYETDITYISKLTRIVMSLFGVWPPVDRDRSPAERIWRFIFIVISYILLNCVLIPGVLFWLLEKRTRVKIATFPPFLFSFMAMSKYGNLIFHEKQIKHCLKHIQEDCKNVIDTNAEYDARMTGRWLVALCGAFMYGSDLSFRLILPFAKEKIVNAQNITIKPLPYRYFFSFNSPISPTYEIIFAVQILSGLVTFIITTSVCGLVAMFVMHACGQLKILIDLTKHLADDDSHEDQDADKKLAEIVEHQIRTAQAEKVAIVSHELEWYRLPNKTVRGIVLMVIISNFPIKITVGKVVDLSFKTYMMIVLKSYQKVVKTAMSCLNILRNVVD